MKTNFSLNDLKDRQLEVLKLYLQGKSQKEMGADLNLTIHSIKQHNENLRKHFEVDTMHQVLVCIMKPVCDDLIQIIDETLDARKPK